MPSVILDACGTLNLYASGRFVAILTAFDWQWYLPAAVEREAQTHRQPDPDDPERLISVPIDLAPAIDTGVLNRCDCESEAELELYVQLATRIGDDGESMGLAIAKCRGWSVLTDDKKARRIAQELGIPILATTEVVKQWAAITKPEAWDLSTVLRAIERFSNYRPGPRAIDYVWWVTSSQSEEPNHSGRGGPIDER